MVYSTGALVASAVICTKGTPEDTSVEIKKGDTLTNVVMVAGRHEKTIATATVKGFIVGNKVVRRGENTIWDGIPTKLRDEEGDAHFGTAEEKLDVRGILVEIPAEDEGGTPAMTVLKVANIKSMTATPIATDQSPSGGGDDNVDGD